MKKWKKFKFNENESRQTVMFERPKRFLTSIQKKQTEYKNKWATLEINRTQNS